MLNEGRGKPCAKNHRIHGNDWKTEGSWFIGLLLTPSGGLSRESKDWETALEVNSAKGTRSFIILGAAFSLRAFMGGVIQQGVFLQEQNSALTAQRVHSKSEAPAQGERPLHRGRDPCLNEPLLGSRLEATVPSSFTRTPRDEVKYSSVNVEKRTTDDGSFNYSPLKAEI